MKILLNALYLTIMVSKKFRFQADDSRYDNVEKKFIQISLLAVSRRRDVEICQFYLTSTINKERKNIQEFNKYLFHGLNITNGISHHWSNVIKFLTKSSLEIDYYIERQLADSIILIMHPRIINMNDRFILFLKKADAKLDIRIRLLPSDISLKYYMITSKCIIPKNILTIRLESLFLNKHYYFGIYTPTDCDSLSENYSKESETVNYINSIILNTLDNQTHLEKFSGILNFQYKFKNNTFPFITYNSTIEHELNVELFDTRYQSFQIKRNDINIKCIFHTEIKAYEDLKTIRNCTENNNSVCLLNGKKTCKDPNSEKSNCNIEADRCNPNPCKNGGSCKLEVLSPANHYRITCTCSKSSHGTICQYSKRCKNCAKGYCNKENQMCSQCNKGWSGDQCSILSCFETYCKNNGNCTIEKGKRKCLCVNGYNGHHCELNCSTICNSSTCEYKMDKIYCGLNQTKIVIGITILTSTKITPLPGVKYEFKTFNKILCINIMIYINIIYYVTLVVFSICTSKMTPKNYHTEETHGEYIFNRNSNVIASALKE